MKIPKIGKVQPCRCSHMGDDPEGACCAHSMRILCCCSNTAVTQTPENSAKNTKTPECAGEEN